METINANAATLSNFEVLEVLQEVRSKQKRSNNQSHLATVTFETIQYLQDKPCSRQSSEILRKYLESLQPYQLTKAEKVMLLNNPPKKELEIQLMIEDSEERLTDEQVQELLDIFRES